MQSHLKSDFLHIMKERGFIADATNLVELDSKLASGPVTGYIGYDATASSLHVGHLLNIMMMRWFQKTGNHPIVLIGGGTTKIGDPSFKANQRPMLTTEEINANAASLSAVFSKIIDFDDDRATMLDNADWLDGLGFIQFLREVGSKFSVNRMLTFESVKSRLDREQSLSLLEFNYMVLQAFDFLELHRRTGCILQMGGSDQWGNIVNGIDLTRRTSGAEVFGLTTPLLETSDGKKMGKSEGGAIWLNPDLTSPYDFWQFWRNTSDADVGRFLKLFTELPMGECERLAALQGAEINQAKIVLADEVTKRLHGTDATLEAKQTAKSVFEENKAGQSLPVFEVPKQDLDEGLSIVRALVLTELAKSGKDAKRLIMDGGARIDDQIVEQADLVLRAEHLTNPIRISAGKKRHAVLRQGM